MLCQEAKSGGCVEVTPAMIEAGARVLAQYLEQPFDETTKWIAELVISAALENCPLVACKEQ